MTRICDYEGSQYRTEFWTSSRAYEDAVERIAMKKMLPPAGDRLIEIGAGFGRLVDLYGGYRQIVLTDYARTQLEEAQRFLGADPRITYVVADVYNLPFSPSQFDTLTMVRVMHHLVNVPAALAEIQRVMRPGGIAIVEHASKQNLKAIFRWALKRQQWNPFSPEPIEFVDLNFNFQPAWMREQFAAAGLPVQNTRTLSHYRIDTFKRLFSTPVLAAMDGLAQNTGNLWQLTPSLFLQARAEKPASNSAGPLFCCPACHHAALVVTGQTGERSLDLTCRRCATVWGARDGIFDFKTPLAGPA
ncbi:MAG: hypothetical protein Kow0031_19450 [Anaerolineae bacterium]